MASASSVLSEDQLYCSICLNVFIKPVTTPCGHTFCKTCITVHWENNSLTQCPLCKETFDKKPDIVVSVVMSELAAEFRKSFKKEPISSLDQHPAQPGEVPCDVCIGRKRKAMKSCLGCLASYCETHLEPHYIAVALKKHKLMDPVENLEDRVCKKHDRPLELFCRTDQTCVCHFCLEKTHENHDTVPLEREYRERKDQIRKERTGFQQMIQERALKVQEVKNSVEISKSEAECEKADSVEVFTVLLASIKRSQAEVIELIEEKQRAAEKQAEGFIKELEQEVTELKRRSTELEKLSHTEDHLHLLQDCPSLSTPPPTKDWSQISIHSEMSVGTVKRAVAQLKKTLSKEMEKLPADKLKRIQQYEVDVSLDPDTAHPKLFLSEDGKQVYHINKRKNLPNNPKRFDHVVNVLGKQGFSSGRFYFEVQVKQKTKWKLGVARESVNRKGQMTVNPENGFWAIELRYGKYQALTNPSALLSLTAKPQKVGMFVDYEKGEVSFYDVETRAHIYSFTGCTFSDKLYPYFNPGLNDGGTNSAPLIICPIVRKVGSKMSPVFKMAELFVHSFEPL